MFYRRPHYTEYKLIRGQVASHPFLASLPVPPPTAPLELLPSLIKLRICTYLAAIDVDGLLCVIMAVPHMAAEGQAVLNSIMTWAGRRIIHLGGCAHSLPQNLLTKDEERLRLDVIYEDPWILDTRKFIDIEKKRRYKLYARAMDYIRASKRHTRPLPFDLAHDLLAPTIKRPANAVLRNLTLKQYYRGGDCTAFYYCDCGKSKGSKNGNVDDGDDIEYGLGQVVLIMTCWTDGPSGYFRGNWTLEDDHGEWAGHRLDIVAPEVVNPDWEDVTAAAKEKLMRFRSQYQ